MHLPLTAHVLRIYIGENQRHGTLHVFEALIYRARVMNMAVRG
jgi:PII-like signaling protein